ncbi:ectoine/hydroxyectoine ABC transporter permease subunit EhuD [Rhizobium esperanzae]|uniref:Ectoine/hydroxyectoine ABC transporter permease subunit EhuD n=1 Tax=Rhizobium esperanzae TaxID=1967781 RepID=A0A246DKL2_9HYPH|nr:ectoine/hydroxyectoine ABC transporter permease subunit EhuD [Rhizobium esperanzae]OWO89466.1 ectoine/hydroxyectoine ABC transporter permease subunit EhuD [Rhizobium esperanzae]
MNLEWRWDFSWEVLPRLLSATINTLIAAGVGYAIAVVIGISLAMLQRTKSPSLRRAVRECVEFVRSTPLILQIFFIFYVGPQFGIQLSPWTSGMLAIGLHYAAYLSEVFRAGIDAVPRGQWEACRALNLSMRDTYCRIVIPQALIPTVPGMGNYLVGILKDTPMLSVIGVAEIMQTATAIGSENYRYLEPFTLVGLIFLLISLPTAALVRLFEIRLRQGLGM